MRCILLLVLINLIIFNLKSQDKLGENSINHIKIVECDSCPKNNLENCLEPKNGMFHTSFRVYLSTPNFPEHGIVNIYSPSLNLMFSVKPIYTNRVINSPANPECNLFEYNLNITLNESIVCNQEDWNSIIISFELYKPNSTNIIGSPLFEYYNDLVDIDCYSANGHEDYTSSRFNFALNFCCPENNLKSLLSDNSKVINEYYDIMGNLIYKTDNKYQNTFQMKTNTLLIKVTRKNNEIIKTEKVIINN